MGMSMFSVHRKSYNGNTPLHCAASAVTGHVKVVDALIRNYGVDQNVLNKQKVPVMNVATIKGQKAVVVRTISN